MHSSSRMNSAARITTPDTKELVATMIATMRAAPGVGLAAPQIGVPLRVIVLEDREELMKSLTPEERRARERSAFPTRVLFNPVLELLGSPDDRVAFFEGCLSVHGYVALVDRAAEVIVTALDENANPVTWQVRGWPARILQHEVDHLDGTLYIDRMRSRSFATGDQARALWGGRPVVDVERALEAGPLGRKKTTED